MDFILLLIASFLYFLPSLVAINTKHLPGIIILNLLLGWTKLGWIGALIWAVMSPKNENK